MGFAVYKFDLGYLKIKYDDSVIVGVKRVMERPLDFGCKNELTDMVFKQYTEYLAGSRKEFDFAFRLDGTDFQKKVWGELIKIPYGETCSYKDIAQRIENPKAVRAVGMANSKNPIIIAIPCHRVIGSNGKLVGYSDGLDMKQILLNIEMQNA